MLRSFSRVLALLALLASGINAQCALYCSLQTAIRSEIPDKPSHHLAGVSHACCPASRTPSSFPPRPNGPCTQQQAGVGAAIEITPLQQPEIPLSVTLLDQPSLISFSIGWQSGSALTAVSSLSSRAACAVMRV